MSEQTSLLKGEGAFARCPWCNAHIIEIKLDLGPIVRIEPHEHGLYALHGGFARLVKDGRVLANGERPIRKLTDDPAKKVRELRYRPHFVTCSRTQAGLEATVKLEP